MGLLSKLKSSSSDKNIVDCGDSLLISTAADFSQQLKSALGKGGEVILDAANLQRIDAVSLQLCTAFFNDAAARKVSVKWISPSDALVKSASLLGLSKQLGLPE